MLMLTKYQLLARLYDWIANVFLMPHVLRSKCDVCLATEKEENICENHRQFGLLNQSAIE